jgi:hypothetical protein
MVIGVIPGRRTAPDPESRALDSGLAGFARAPE